MLLDLTLPLWLSLCAPPEPAEEAAPPAELRAEPTRLVFAADVGANTIIFFPRAVTWDLSAFVGASLPGVQRRRPLHWAAIGLRLTGTIGPVLLQSNLDYFHYGLHPHLTITGASGRRGRLNYSAGLGPIFGFDQAEAAHPQPASPYGMEFEGRLGYLVNNGASGRWRATIGGMLRVSTQGKDFPLVFFGPFLGVAIAPR